MTYDNEKRKITFDVLEWIKVLKTYKRPLCITMAISVVVAIIMAFSIPRIYKSSVMLAPESLTQQKACQEKLRSYEMEDKLWHKDVCDTHLLPFCVEKRMGDRETYVERNKAWIIRTIKSGL